MVDLFAFLHFIHVLSWDVLWVGGRNKSIHPSGFAGLGKAIGEWLPIGFLHAIARRVFAVDELP